MGLVARTCRPALRSGAVADEVLPRPAGAALPGAVTSKDSRAAAESSFVCSSEPLAGFAPSSKMMSARPASRMVPPQRSVALRSSCWMAFKTGSDVELLISVMLRRPKCSQTRSGNQAGCAGVSNEFCDICLHYSGWSDVTDRPRRRRNLRRFLRITLWHYGEICSSETCELQPKDCSHPGCTFRKFRKGRETIDKARQCS